MRGYGLAVGVLALPQAVLACDGVAKEPNGPSQAASARLVFGADDR